MSSYIVASIIIHVATVKKCTRALLCVFCNLISHVKKKRIQQHTFTTPESVFLTSFYVMETRVVPRNLIWSMMTFANSMSSYTHTLFRVPLVFVWHMGHVQVCAACSVTFSFATLWENGQVPSACLHFPRRNLHRNNISRPEMDQLWGKHDTWKQKLTFSLNWLITARLTICFVCCLYVLLLFCMCCYFSVLFKERSIVKIKTEKSVKSWKSYTTGLCKGNT